MLKFSEIFEFSRENSWIFFGSQNFERILFGSQEVQKMNMKMEIRKKENEYDTKETFWEKLFYEVENKYACLTWEAPRKFPAEQKTDLNFERILTELRSE